MENQEPGINSSGHVNRSLELIIKIGLVIGLLVWCFLIIKPFLMITLWGVIIAVAIYPMYSWLRKVFGNRSKLAALVVTLIMLAVIIVPAALLGESLFEAVRYIKERTHAGQSLIPPPPESVNEWPLVGESLYTLWHNATTDLASTAMEHKEKLLSGLTWFLHTLTSAGLGALMFIASILIAGVILVFSEEGAGFGYRIAVRLMGEKGNETVANAELTIRNVARGILGVAFIQAFLAGMGFLIAGIPGAGLWAFICFMLALIQIGIGPVIIGVLIYAFIKLSMVAAILLLIWSAFIMVIDNVLKPLLLGRGAPVPMLVVFLGAIGGFIGFGIIGLFVGAVVLSMGYNLFLQWLEQES